MAAFSQLLGGLVAAAAIFIVGWLGKGQFDAMKVQFEALKVRYDSRFDGLESEIREVKEGIRQIRTELATMRPDLTHVALAMQAPPQTA